MTPRFWQLRLSTAVCLMLLAGVLLYLNVHIFYRIVPPGETADWGWSSMMHPEPPPTELLVSAQRGWPFPRHAVIAFLILFERPVTYVNLVDDGELMVNSVFKPENAADAANYAFRRPANYATRYFVWNGIAGVAILIASGVLLEWSARWRDRRRGSIAQPSRVEIA